MNLVMWNRGEILFIIICLFWSFSARAQKKIYADVGFGIGYNFVEGAHFGKGTRPFKARNFILHELPFVQVRAQLSDALAISAGYRGSSISWGYKLQVPDDVTVNTSQIGDEWGSASDAYLHQIPLQVHYRLKRYNIHPLDTVGQQYLLSFRLEAQAGGGLSRRANVCLGCGSLTSSLDTPLGATNSTQDIIQFREQPYYARTWGSFLTAGATVRFYHRNKERLNLSIFLTQGLRDMVIIPVQYSYNGWLGSEMLRARGTGISATVGYPFLVNSFTNK